MPQQYEPEFKKKIVRFHLDEGRTMWEWAFLQRQFWIGVYMIFQEILTELPACLKKLYTILGRIIFVNINIRI